MQKYNLLILSSLLVISLLFLSGCLSPAPPATNKSNGAQLPNPASANCINQGYTSVIRTAADGGQYGVCTYGTAECDEWKLLRGQCCILANDCTCEDSATPKCENQNCTCVPNTGSNGTAIANPASVNCVNKGYVLEMRKEAAGEYGICKFGAAECEEWKLFHGECCLRASDCNIKCNGTISCTDSKCACAAVVPEKPKENKTYAVTTKTTAQLLDDQDNLCDVLFADQNPSGAFSIQSYRWTASGESSKPDELPVGAGLENSAYFNGLTFPSISALGFKVYKQTIDNHEYNIMACGSVIFRSEGEEIEKFSDYSISYKAPGFAQAIRLNMCDNLQKMNYVSGNATISQYRFKCYGIE